MSVQSSTWRPRWRRTDVLIRPAYLIPLAAVAVNAAAAQVGPARLALEATTDHRRRGISWSDGRPTAIASGRAQLASGWGAEAILVATRGSARNQGAEGLIDLALRHDRAVGAVILHGAVIGHVTPDRISASFAEGEAGMDVTLGPANLGATIDYAPAQPAVGGEALRLGADASVAIIGTPWTLRAGAGRNSGDDSRTHSRRLRPRGSYTDYALGLDYVAAPWIVSADFSGTTSHAQSRTFDPRQRHAGKRIAVAIRIDL
jgi:hypothetical protein